MLTATHQYFCKLQELLCAASVEGTTPSLEVRAILDLGSQQLCVTARVREALKLRKLRSEFFSSDKGDHRACDIVELRIMTKNGNSLTVTTVVVPHICDLCRLSQLHLARLSINILPISGPEEAQGLQRFWPLHHLAFKFLNLSIMCSLHKLLCILVLCIVYYCVLC